MKLAFAKLFLLFAFVAVACPGASPKANSPQLVILDTDIGDDLRVDDRGMTVRSSDGPIVDVCLNSDSDPFFRFFMPRLLNFTFDATESH